MKKQCIIAKDVQPTDRIKVGRLSLVVKDALRNQTGGIVLNCHLAPIGSQRFTLVVPAEAPLQIRRK